MKLSTVIHIALSAAFLVGAGLIVILVHVFLREQALAEAEAKAELLLARNLATHQYFSHELKPSVFEAFDRHQDSDYFDPAWMSSTYAIRQIDRNHRFLTDERYYYKECAVNARSPENEADAFERAFIEEINRSAGLQKRSSIRRLDGAPFLQVLRRGEVMEKPCLRCHSSPQKAPGELVARFGPERSFGREEGEVVSAVSIRIPLSEAFAEVDRFTFLLSGLLVLVVGMLFATQYLITRRLIFRPLEKLRLKAAQISNDRNHLGTQITPPFGAELRGLAATFNSLSASLHDQVVNLEVAVADRTNELARANTRLADDLDRRRVMEAALVESEELYRTLAEAAFDGICVHEQGRLLQANSAFAAMFGYTPDEVVGMQALQFIAPECRTMVAEKIRSSGAETYEATGLRRDGSQILLELSSRETEYQGRLVRVVALRDITEQRRGEEQIRAERAFLQSVIDCVPEAILVVGLDHRIMMMNQAARAQAHRLNSENRIVQCYEALHGNAVPCGQLGYPCPLETIRRKPSSVALTYSFTDSGGARRFMEIRAAPLWNPDGRLSGIIKTFRDVTERVLAEKSLKENEQRFNYLAHHDALTGLPNRLLFQDRLHHAIKLARREKRIVAVLFLDLDRFKQVNDSLGHDTGDHLLQAVSRRLQECVRASDTVARLAGDEFTVILEEITEQQGAETVSGKIIEDLTRVFHVDGHEVRIGTSIGISLYPQHGEEPAELMRRADAAMYAAKSEGRGTYRIFREGMEEHADKRLSP